MKKTPYESSQKKDVLEVEQIVRKYAYLVKSIAYHLISKLPDSVQVDDLIQVGMIGLIDAARLYDETKGASFETYANIRIRGSMIDELRRNSWLPQSALKNIRRISSAISEIEAKNKRAATSKEIASELGIALDEYHKLAAGAYVVDFRDISDINEAQISEKAQEESPLAAIEKDELKSILVGLISTLSDKEQLVLSLYYNEGLTLKEIGNTLGVSEARVSQIHGEAIARLKARANRYTKG